MKISLCSKICSGCGFSKKGTEDTLYSDLEDMMDFGTVFPCHSYLEAHTGSKNTGTEALEEVQVCRGYVAYMKKNHIGLLETYRSDTQYLWYQRLLPYIDNKELLGIHTEEGLKASHTGLRDKSYLGNTIKG